MDVFLYGLIHFSADPAIDEYQKGAVFDEAHLLRVLREALETGDFKRLEKNMSPDCEYYGYKGRRITGSGAIIRKIREVFDAQHEDKNNIEHQAVAVVTEVLDPDKAEYGVGKECLISYSVNTHGSAKCIVFIDVENGKINALKFTYESCYRFEVDKNSLIPAGMPVFTEFRNEKD